MSFLSNAGYAAKLQKMLRNLTFVVLDGSATPDGSATETDAVDALQACIRDIRSWMVQDKLRLNDSKTEFLIIGTRAQLNLSLIHI